MHQTCIRTMDDAKNKYIFKINYFNFNNSVCEQQLSSTDASENVMMTWFWGAGRRIHPWRYWWASKRKFSTCRSQSSYPQMEKLNHKSSTGKPKGITWSPRLYRIYVKEKQYVLSFYQIMLLIRSFGYLPV